LITSNAKSLVAAEPHRGSNLAFLCFTANSAFDGIGGESPGAESKNPDLNGQNSPAYRSMLLNWRD
jgi:hypothetical protein